LVLAAITVLVAPRIAHSWSESDFENRPLVAYPIPTGRDDLIGSLQIYTVRKGDTLLDVARWYGLSPTEVSNANNHMDWWSPPAGKLIVIPTEHILPASPRLGIVMNIPEMRLYYYYPTPSGGRRRIGKARFAHTAYAQPRSAKGRRAKKAIIGAHPSVIYTFPVGLGRYDWRTPVGTWTIRDKTYNPTWVVPDDIYQEHLERDGEAEHVIEGGDPDNPLGHYRLALTLPMYALHGTNVPWGVGMEVSHGCVRLYPEDIDRLFHKTSVGTPGRFVYQPVKYGWRAGTLYVEVHEDLYGVYPGLWRHAISLAKSQGVFPDVDLLKLEKAVEEKTGVPTYVMPGPEPASAMPPVTETASSMSLPPPGSAATAPDADTRPSIGTSSGTDTESTDENAGRAATTATAIAPSPAVSVIRPAPESATVTDDEDNGTGDSGGADTTVSEAGDESAQRGSVVSAPMAPAPANNNGANSAAGDANDSEQWQRMPSGTMPIE